MRYAMRYMVTAAFIALLAWVVSTAPVAAQTYPAKPVRVMVPWPPSGSADIVARIVFPHASTLIGQQLVIENRGGAAGSIGAELVAKAPADGYTIMLHTATHVANPHLYSKLPYDTLRDFTPISNLCAQLGMLVVHPSLPVKSVKELLSLARARPNELTFSSAGNGSFPHLATALLMQMSGVRMTHVPYKGAGPAAVAIVSGEVQVLLVSASTVLPHVQSKKLRAVAVPSATRLKQFPDLPTIAEAGLPGYEMTPWIGVFAPAGVPAGVVQRIDDALRRTVENPQVSERLYAALLNPWYMEPQEFAKRIRVDYDRYARLVKLTGAKID